MIHTFVLTMRLSATDTRIGTLLPAFLDLREKGTGVRGIRAGINCIQAKNGSTQFMGVYLNLQVDSLAFTGKCNLDTPGDYQAIADGIDEVLEPTGLTIQDFSVYRMDYCWNAIVRDPQERALLMKMFSKCDQCGGRLRVRKDYSDGSKNRLPEARKYNAHFHNVKRGIQVYDKTREREDKGKLIQPYEQDAVRIEYQMLFEEIKEEELFKYWDCANDETAYEHLFRCSEMFFTGDFYSVRAADVKLRREGLAESMVEKLHAYLVTVSNFSIGKAAANYKLNGKKKPITEATARSYRNLLEAHGICPVPIPKSSNISRIPNPFRSVWEKGGAL